MPSHPIRYIRNRWNAESGYREVLAVAFPLIMSTGAWSIQHFVDRMFLTWYSPETVAASMPAGMLNFVATSLFIGTASYVGTFVAQYYGAGEHQRIGAVMWQGLYVALMGGVLIASLIPFAGIFFSFVGHEPVIRDHETVYFRILCLGAIPAITTAALSGFFSGRGRTWPVMWADLAATGVNVILDYILIFGKFGLPELGIAGAAIATVISGVVASSILFTLMAVPMRNRVFAVSTGWRFDPALFRRLMRFGLPSGVQFMLDVAGFAIFLLLLGRLGTASLAATNIAFNINTLAFMPMIGLGIAVSVLVGQRLGANDIPNAERVAWSGFHVTGLYMGTVALLYVAVPGIFLYPFSLNASQTEFREIRDIAVVLLRFVALYSLFDTMNIIFASAIKGAGDTRFVMRMIFSLSVFLLAVPSWIAVKFFHADVYALWVIATFYVCALGTGFLIRFLGGKWKTMRVIEIPPTMIAAAPPETPGSEIGI